MANCRQTEPGGISAAHSRTSRYEWGAADAAEAVPGSKLPEPGVIAAVRDGSVDAMALLYQRHKAYGTGFTLTLVRDEHEANEVLQDAFASTFRAIVTGPGPVGDFRACLRTAIGTTAVGAWRRRMQETVREPGVMDAVHGRVIDDRFTAALRGVIAAEAAEHLRAELALLPPRWQQVLWYTDVLTEPPRRIAPLTGLSPNAVSALLLRARNSLRTAGVTAEAESWELLSDWHPGYLKT